MTTIQSLRARAIALRSSVHNEQQLSAVELAGMVAKKTNELIDVINELTSYIDKLENGVVSVNYDGFNEEVTIA